MADKHPDQEKREHIPTRDSVPTMFHPYHDLLMVVPIPDIDHVGTIILPDKAKILMNEGHIVEKGPLCTDKLGIGDCVTWDANSEYRMNVDDVPFVLVRESAINMRISRAELERTLTEGEDDNRCAAIASDRPARCLRRQGHSSKHIFSAEGISCPACGEPMNVPKPVHIVGCPEDPANIE